LLVTILKHVIAAKNLKTKTSDGYAHIWRRLWIPYPELHHIPVAGNAIDHAIRGVAFGDNLPNLPTGIFEGASKRSEFK
jgi:hypothetical protein